MPPPGRSTWTLKLTVNQGSLYRESARNCRALQTQNHGGCAGGRWGKEEQKETLGRKVLFTCKMGLDSMLVWPYLALHHHSLSYFLIFSHYFFLNSPSACFLSLVCICAARLKCQLLERRVFTSEDCCQLLESSVGYRPTDCHANY